MSAEGIRRHESNGHSGYSGTSLLMMFVGGALAGAAVAYLAQTENRARVRSLARRTRERAGHLPGAMRAAKEAFVEAYHGEADGEAAVIASKHKKRAEAEEA